MNINLQPNITGTNVNLVRGATQADLTNAVNNSRTYRDESEAFSIVSENKSIVATDSANSASSSATTASNAANTAITKANEANSSAISASASETVCIDKTIIATDKADISTAQAVIATNKAIEANNDADTATTQAGIAITKASEASTSASNALVSANNADTSEANALTYRNEAESFANSVNPSNIVHITGTETIIGDKTFTGTVTLPSTTSIGTITSTELGYVDGVTSSIQTQIDNKIEKVTSTDNAVVRFDGITGAVQNSSVSIDDNGNLIHTQGGVYSYSEYGFNSNDYAGSFVYIRRYALNNTTPVYEHQVVGERKAAILANGAFQSATNVYGSTSDIKLKEKIVNTSPKLDKLMQVQVRNFNYIGQEDKQIGVIAQEIEEIFPSLVFETKDTKQVEVTKERIIPAVEEVKDEEGNVITEAKPESIEEYIETETQETGEVTKNVKYSIIYMMMLKGMQEMRAEYTSEIEALKSRIEILEGAK